MWLRIPCRASDSAPAIPSWAPGGPGGGGDQSRGGCKPELFPLKSLLLRSVGGSGWWAGGRRAREALGAQGKAGPDRQHSRGASLWLQMTDGDMEAPGQGAPVRGLANAPWSCAEARLPGTCRWGWTPTSCGVRRAGGPGSAAQCPGRAGLSAPCSGAGCPSSEPPCITRALLPVQRGRPTPGSRASRRAQLGGSWATRRRLPSGR